MFEENTPVAEQPQEPSPETTPPETPAEAPPETPPEAPTTEEPVETPPETPPAAPEENINFDEIVDGAVQPPQKTEKDKARFTATKIFERHPDIKDEMMAEEQGETEERLYHKLNKDRALDICDDLTKNPKERAAIYKIWESGQGFRKNATLKEQLKDVQAIITRKKNEQVEQLKDQKGKGTPSPTGPGQQLDTTHEEPKLPIEVAKTLGKKTWDKKLGVWVLPGGKKVSPSELGLS